MIDIMIEVMLPEEGVEDALIDADDVEHMWYKSKLGNSCVWLIEQRLEKHLENTFGTRTAKRNTCNIKLFLMCLLATETSNILKIKQNLLAFQINPSCLLSAICAVFDLLKHYDYKSCVLSSWGDLSFYVVGQYCQRENTENTSHWVWPYLRTLMDRWCSYLICFDIFLLRTIKPETQELFAPHFNCDNRLLLFSKVLLFAPWW